MKRRTFLGGLLSLGVAPVLAAELHDTYREPLKYLFKPVKAEPYDMYVDVTTGNHFMYDGVEWHCTNLK